MATVKVGVIANNLDEIFQRGVFTGIQQIAEQHEISVIGHPYDHDPRAPYGLSLNLKTISGLIVIANVLSDAQLHEIRAMGIPISLISHQVGDLPVVMSNNVQGIAALIHHMIVQCKRREVVLVAGLLDQRDGRERHIAFRRELIRHGLDVTENRFVRGDFSPEITVRSVQALIDRGEKFDAIFAADYLMAIAAIETLRAADIKVPEDVSVVGFGDDAEAEAAGLTTVDTNIVEVGRCAANQLISQINGATISGVTQLGVRLVVRASC